MRSYVEFISSVTADTPGTVLVLHFDEQRYLVGNLSEGTSRACLQHGVGLRRVNEILLTGRTRWSNIGGMLGIVLGFADTKKAAAEAQAEQEQVRVAERAKRLGQHGIPLVEQSKRAIDASPFLRIHGPPNLNYAIATARRFIFRTGMPIDAVEHHAPDRSNESSDGSIPPTWEDKYIKVWAMPIQPTFRKSTSRANSPERLHSRKRSFSEMQDNVSDAVDETESIPKRIVKEMFSSDWSMDKLFKKPLKDVQMPASIFVRDPLTKHLVTYTGPAPGSGRPVPDIDVLVRQPWPAVLTEELPPGEVANESMCYIIQNHPQRGKFNPRKAKELGVPSGPLFGKLTAGHSVKNTHGEEITPEMVLEAGKKGGGFAIVELPAAEYVECLVNRPEWRDQRVMDSVGAIIWILGSGVFSDPRLSKFREEFSHLEHLISSSDVLQDRLVLETAVKSAWRHNNEEPATFPKLLTDHAHIHDQSTENARIDTNGITLGQRGLKIVLEPRFEVKDNELVPAVDESAVTKEVQDEHNRMLVENTDVTNPPIPILHDEDMSKPSWYTTSPYAGIEVTTLGTGSSHPSTHRNVSATLVRIPQRGSYIFDCGEGTLGSLRRLYKKAQLDNLLKDLRMIWISHMHADHHLGLTSVIRAWYDVVHNSAPGPDVTDPNIDLLREGGPRLAIVSDAPMLHWLREYSSIEDYGYSRLLPLATEPTRFANDRGRATPTTLRLALTNHTINTDQTPASSYLTRLGLSSLSTVLVPHCRGAQAISCTFPLPCNNSSTSTEPPTFKLSYSGDTRPTLSFARIGTNSDLLIHEATFDDDMQSEAFAKKHSTAGEALTVAKEMGARAVILTHFSQRYPKFAGPGGGQGRAPRETGLELNTPASSAADVPDAGGEDTLTTQPWSLPLTSSSNSNHPLDLSRQYQELMSHPAGAAAAIAEAGIKVIPAFDYMRLRLGDLDKAIAVQGRLRALEEFTEMEREREKDREREMMNKIRFGRKKGKRGSDVRSMSAQREREKGRSASRGNETQRSVMT